MPVYYIIPPGDILADYWEAQKEEMCITKDELKQAIKKVSADRIVSWDSFEEKLTKSLGFKS
jgi:hypothetical protein